MDEHTIHPLDVYYDLIMDETQLSWQLELRLVNFPTKDRS
jgi:hypothetical protein